SREAARMRQSMDDDEFIDLSEFTEVAQNAGLLLPQQMVRVCHVVGLYYLILVKSHLRTTEPWRHDAEQEADLAHSCGMLMQHYRATAAAAAAAVAAAALPRKSVQQ
ncbi:MAG: hypothetical protein ACT6T3_21830, partial [Agrobacterium sp.]|uniref:hypothetical protein n=1 Tax=Agrobacterium sp. TaxID=361 RepID=UPI0040342521